MWRSFSRFLSVAGLETPAHVDVSEEVFEENSKASNVSLRVAFLQAFFFFPDFLFYFFFFKFVLLFLFLKRFHFRSFPSDNALLFCLLCWNGSKINVRANDIVFNQKD